VIPDAAVESAKSAVRAHAHVDLEAEHLIEGIVHAILEAAAPHMRQAFFLEMNLRAVKEELNTPFRKATYGDDMR